MAPGFEQVPPAPAAGEPPGFGAHQQQYDMGAYQYPQQHHQQFIQQQQQQQQYHGGDPYGHVAYPGQNFHYSSAAAPPPPPQAQPRAQPQPKRIPSGEHRQTEDGSAIFKLSVEKENGDIEGATVQVALDGVKVLDHAGERIKKIYTLDVITSWKLRDYPGVSDRLQLTMWTRSSVDDREKSLTLLASARVLKLVADTLTCAIMQVCEMLGLEPGDLSVRVNGGEVANTLAGESALIRTVNEHAEAAEDIEFWTGAEKAGWMMSQGEHIKNWRRRYFVLKQRHLFRFLTSDVDKSTKARGVIDLSTVTEVRETKEKASALFGTSMPFGQSSGRTHNVLTLVGETGKPCFKIALEDAEALADWAIAIRSAADEVSARRRTHADFVQDIEGEFDGGEGTSGGASPAAPQGVVNVHDHSRGGGGGGAAPPRQPQPQPPRVPNDIYKWQPAYTNDGRVYYYNTETGETKWEL